MSKTLVDFDEIKRYEEGVQAYLSGEMDPDRFMAFRLQHGIYGQRQDGVHMVRIKLPGGDLSPEQLQATADALANHSQHNVAHITTRQDIQIHYVPVKETATVMRILGESGLTTREACGNTVRNISACPLAGSCPREHVDITTFVNATAERFLRHPLTQHLPRKFKMSMSGCETDCAQGMMHDLGVVAVESNGRFGFKVLAGGGLGHKPREAIVVEEFIEEKDLLPCIEALIALHNRHSDRKRRAKARIKFLVERFGTEGFIQKYQEELARTRVAYQDAAHPSAVWSKGKTGGEAPTTGAPRKIFPQKQAGLNVFTISVPIGDITAPQMRGIAQLMKKHGLNHLRATQDQKLMVLNVPSASLSSFAAGVQALGLDAPKTGDNVVACPGTSTCRLGITSSKVLGAKLNGGPDDLRIRVSGCHNGCAQPEMGDIGIYGEGKRLHAKLVPHYQMYFGGDGRLGGGLALKGPSVPAARIETAVERIQQTYAQNRQNSESFAAWAHRQGQGYFDTLLQDLKNVSLEEVVSVAKDHGDAEQFKVLQLGGGECAGAAQGLVSANFSEAAHERNYRDAFVSQRKPDAAIECSEQMLRLIGQSLLFLAGRELPPTLEDMAAELRTALPQSASLVEELTAILQALGHQKADYDEAEFKRLAKTMDSWMIAAGAACQSIDRQLDLSASLPREQPLATVVDLSAFACPLHYIKARNELKKYRAGDVVDFVFASTETQQVSSSLQNDGHQILAVEQQGTTTKIKIQKAAS